MSQNIIKVGGAYITLLGYLLKETLPFIRISKRVATSVSNTFYYINTSEIPSELSREKFISSHVKITYLHT